MDPFDQRRRDLLQGCRPAAGNAYMELNLLLGRFDLEAFFSIMSVRASDLVLDKFEVIMRKLGYLGCIDWVSLPYETAIGSEMVSSQKQSLCREDSDHVPCVQRRCRITCAICSRERGWNNLVRFLGPRSQVC
ncbi:hypothetical protein F1559_001251 [Cyanidiococcus yangmingshanensis]|uniref:Uncharacterized protein n=1 Tax=Cyanidiococcus yangmingshanensis TaxID=2690220 RepID=A0A7J7ID32_9RHOD|nr:hypothetical protein F1559_001251 [Cyanidiococcus yangmingshanensis]